MKKIWLLGACLWGGLFAQNLSAFDCTKRADASDTNEGAMGSLLLLSLSLDDLMNVSVSTTSKAEENIAEAPGVVSVITADEIEHFGANSLYEVLERVVGVYQPMLFMYPKNILSFRGDASADLDVHVLLLINGRPLKEGLTGGINYPIYSAFPLATIEKIEVVRGPGSVLYGTNAFSGVVNIITKKGAELAAGTHEGQLGLAGGSFGARKADAYFGCHDQGLSISGGLTYRQEDGWDFQAVDEAGVSGSKKWGEDNLGVYLRGEYGGWSVDLGAFNAKNAQMGAQLLWSLQADQADTRRIFADVGYTHEFSEHARLQTNLTYNRRSTDLSTLYDRLDEGNEDWLLEATHYWENSKLSWLSGATLYQTSGHSTMFLKDAPVEIDILKDYRETSYTLYSQASYQATGKLKLIAGAQAVKPEGLSWSVVPRLGAIYQFNPNMGFKALFSKAYRAASEFENSVDITPIIVGNPDLTPETVKTYDLQFFYQTPKSQWALTYFHSHQADLIAQALDPAANIVSFANQSELKQHGLELETKLNPTENFSVIGSLVYQANRQGELKNYSALPTWTAKIGLSYAFSRYFNAGLYDNYFSAAHDVNVKYGVTQYVNPEADAVHLMTLNLNLDLGQWLGISQHDSLTLNGYIYNLLDEDVYSPEIVRGVINTLPARQGRGFYLGLKYYF